MNAGGRVGVSAGCGGDVVSGGDKRVALTVIDDDAEVSVCCQCRYCAGCVDLVSAVAVVGRVASE